ncbi:MAG: tetratricopeptide repeat protein [Trueperaceae bacterium]
MHLYTLGKLALSDEAKLKRVKPLLLLCYLALEGPKERRFLVELFWPNSSSGLASLSTAIYRISQDAPGAIEADELKVWTHLETDVQHLLDELRHDSLGVSLYTGAFLEGISVPDISNELADWMLETRESLATKVQQSLLQQAERMAALGQFKQAAEHTVTLLGLPGSSEPEPEALLRCQLLLLSGEHKEADNLKKQLAEYGIESKLSNSEAKVRLRQIFVGRSVELEQLASLQSGQWAWLRGGGGLGKTSLLMQVHGRYLAGQSGLPYATLEPLVGETVNQGSEAILRRLLRQEGCLKLDGWEHIDPESQALFKRLRIHRSNLKVIIASTEAPAFAVDKLLELSPLSQEDLESELWERTGGVPSLVSAYMRGEPLAQALASALQNLSKKARDLYLALALLQEPDVALVRRALHLPANTLAEALEELLSAGLAQASGKAWPTEVAKEYLEAHPALLRQLALPLARVLENSRALPLYQRTRALWTDKDLPKIQEAYEELAQETLQRGFLKRAIEILEEVPLNEPLRLLKARALENVGMYKQAFEVLGAEQSLPSQALRGQLLWRLGEIEEARILASKLQNSKTMDIRAEALFTLASIAWGEGSFKEAEEKYGRAAALWQALDKRELWADALIGEAVARSDGNKSIGSIEEKLAEAAQVAGENEFLQARILLNKATTYHKRERYREAIPLFQQLIPMTQILGTKELESVTWNNLGACFFDAGSYPNETKEAYEHALTLARDLGEPLLIGSTLANLAEVTKNPITWDEAIRILEEGGHHAAAEQQKRSRDELLLSSSKQRG